jgi:hypothetical protein
MPSAAFPALAGEDPNSRPTCFLPVKSLDHHYPNIVCHDVPFLPIALDLSFGAKVP